MVEVQIMADGLRFPEGPVAMADGSVIVGEIAGAAVTRIAGDGGKSPIGQAGGGPNGLATGPDGALYVCNNGGNEYAQGGFLSTGPAKDYRGGFIQRIDDYVEALVAHPARDSKRLQPVGSSGFS